MQDTWGMDDKDDVEMVQWIQEQLMEQQAGGALDVGLWALLL